MYNRRKGSQMDLQEFEQKKTTLEQIAKRLSDSAKNPDKITMKEVLDLRAQAEKLYKELNAEVNKHIEDIETTIASIKAS